VPPQVRRTYGHQYPDAQYKSPEKKQTSHHPAPNNKGISYDDEDSESDVRPPGRRQKSNIQPAGRRTDGNRDFDSEVGRKPIPQVKNKRTYGHESR
jgi:hypothetical protein